jgi:Mg-chelatase subunit ChlD
MQHDFILLDRSGSMIKNWIEALHAVNSYVATLAATNVDTGVTLATFDGDNHRLIFDIIRDRITPKTWRAVSNVDCEPRGWTPLSDAIGKIVDLAKAGNYDKVCMIIMTDGEENYSSELSVDDAKRLLDECRAKNWQVVFLGADFQNARQARSYGNTQGQTMSASAGTYVAHTLDIAAKRADYGATGAGMNFTEEEKKKLNKTK